MVNLFLFGATSARCSHTGIIPLSTELFVLCFLVTTVLLPPRIIRMNIHIQATSVEKIDVVTAPFDAHLDILSGDTEDCRVV